MSHLVNQANGSNRLIIPSRQNPGYTSKNSSPNFRQREKSTDFNGLNLKQDTVTRFNEENKDLHMNLNQSNNAEENQNWYEIRVLGKNPERRGYHSSFISNKKLFVYGGHDIREGSLSTLWMMNLANLQDLDKPEFEQDKKLMWHLIDTSGPNPGAISHHSSVVYNDRMYLFGGSKANGEENKKFYSLDLKSYKWEAISSRGQIPETRDEHSAIVYEGSMIIFGGFVNGVRSHDIFRYYFNDNRWELVQQLSEEYPPARAGHSAVPYGDSMFVFAGKDEENNKLNDLWMFNFNEYIWRQIKSQSNNIPLSRSGHSCSMYNDYLIVFGGIHEVTKELDDLQVFNLRTKKWVVLFEEALHSPNRQKQYGSILSASNQNSGRYGFSNFQSSPTNVKKKQSFMYGQSLPFKIDIEGNTSNVGSSPVANRQKSSVARRKTVNSQQVSRQSSKRRSIIRQSFIAMGGLPAPITTKDNHHHVELESPTSISMKNSFIIKNADPSFESYYKQMTKRKVNMSINVQNGQNLSGANQSYFTNGNNPTGVNHSMNHQNDNNMQLYGKVQSKRPAARDGHTGLIHGDSLIVFGGDRHHMPFNDMFTLDLKSEFISKGHLFTE